MSIDNPMSLPEWRATSLESRLIRQLLGIGLTSLGRANYADGMGEYFTAFFSLSVGLERLLKLILNANEHFSVGAVLGAKEQKSLSHKLRSLSEKVDEIESLKAIQLFYYSPVTEIEQKILDELDKFANAGVGRYANFAIMRGEPNASEFEPISSWWKNVAAPILSDHFKGRPVEFRAKENSQIVEASYGDMLFIMLSRENGTPIESAFDASFASAENAVVGRYGRFYCFKIVRRYCEIFKVLTESFGDIEGGEMWFGQYENFDSFITDDHYGKNRKVWPLD